MAKTLTLKQPAPTRSKSKTPIKGTAALDSKAMRDLELALSGIRPELLDRMIKYALKQAEEKKRLKQFDGADIEDKRAVRKGIKLRKVFERPRPDLPADAPANRKRKQVALTLPPDLIEEINTYIEGEDMDRSRFIEAAIRNALPPKPS